MNSQLVKMPPHLNNKTSPESNSTLDRAFYALQRRIASVSMSVSTRDWLRDCPSWMKQIFRHNRRYRYKRIFVCTWLDGLNIYQFFGSRYYSQHCQTSRYLVYNSANEFHGRWRCTKRFSIGRPFYLKIFFTCDNLLFWETRICREQMEHRCRMITNANAARCRPKFSTNFPKIRNFIWNRVASKWIFSSVGTMALQSILISQDLFLIADENFKKGKR